MIKAAVNFADRGKVKNNLVINFGWSDYIEYKSK